MLAMLLMELGERAELEDSWGPEAREQDVESSGDGGLRKRDDARFMV